MIFLITRASELEFFDVFRKNESISGEIDVKQGYTQAASDERKIFKVMFKNYF